MSPLRIYVEGIGLWSKQLADYAALQTCLAGQAPEPPPAKPAATTLPPNERRRAPESVLLAVEVAGQAAMMSGRDAATLACIFSSSHGDQAITDYMCATLASAPTKLSPTRFHNSVHNAPAGYWTIATGCHEASSAVCAHRLSFGAGLLEAISSAIADQRPMLLVCSDIAGVYPLVEETGCTQSFGCALVISPTPSDATRAALDITLVPHSTHDMGAVPLPEWLTSLREANASADALPLLALLARGHGECRIGAAASLSLQIALQPITPDAPVADVRRAEQVA